MRVRSSPLRSFIIRNLVVVGSCLLSAALLQPSRQLAAPLDGEAQRSPQAKASAPNPKPSQAEQARVNSAYGKLPLSFEANQGQTDRRVRFLSHGSGYSLFLTPHEAVLSLRAGKTPRTWSKAPGTAPFPADSKLPPPAVLHMQLVGGNANAAMAGKDELPGKTNYLLGNDPSQWRTGVSNYRKVEEDGVYPGINLVYYGTQRQLEYDFVLEPGANPLAIRLALQGADRLRIDAQGNLVVSVRGGEVSFQKPVAYQIALDGAREPVAAQFAIKGRRHVAFKVGKHDPSRSLIIDPTLAYSTFIGGSLIDGASAIAVAPDGTAFITGETFSANYPTVNALYPTNGAGGEVAMVSKVSADGSSLIYSTYLGCSPTIGYGIAVDSVSEAYVTGATNCPTFPTTPDAFGNLCGADGKCGASWNPQGYTVYNCFVTKFNVEGTALVYSGLLAYYDENQCHAIAVDSAQNAYVTGEVGANIFPTLLVAQEVPPPPFCTYNGFQTSLGGSGGAEYKGIGTDAFVVKVDATGSELLYCTYLGGSDEDVGFGIAVDSNENAYVTGVTYSLDFPLSGAPLQGAYAGGGDAFFTQVNTNPSAAGAASKVYSTYLGGSGLDQGNGVAVDSTGAAYVAGLSTSKASTFGFKVPTTGYQDDCSPATTSCLGNAFVAKLATNTTDALDYFTFLGGDLATSALGIAVDSAFD